MEKCQPCKRVRKILRLQRWDVSEKIAYSRENDTLYRCRDSFTTVKLWISQFDTGFPRNDRRACCWEKHERRTYTRGRTRARRDATSLFNEELELGISQESYLNRVREVVAIAGSKRRVPCVISPSWHDGTDPKCHHGCRQTNGSVH